MAKKITMVEMGQIFDRYITKHFRTKTLAAEYFGVKSPRITLHASQRSSNFRTGFTVIAL